MATKFTHRAWPYALLILANLFWAGNWVTARAVREAFGPMALNFWRWAIATLVLAPIVLPGLLREWSRLRPVLRQHGRLLAGLSLLGVILFQAFVYIGLQSTTAINGVLLNSTMPIFMMVCAWAIDRDRVGVRQLAGIGVSLAGIMVIVMRGQLARWSELEFNAGDAWILAAMPVWALYSVLLRRRPAELGGMQLVFVLSILSLPVLAVGYAMEQSTFPAHWPDLPAAAGVLYIGLFASVAAFFCWNAAVAAVGPNVAGFTLHLLPAFGAVLAMLFLGERPEWFHLWGVLGILAGVALATMPRRRIGFLARP